MRRARQMEQRLPADRHGHVPVHGHRGQHPALGAAPGGDARRARPPRRAPPRAPSRRTAATSSRRSATRSAPPSPRPPDAVAAALAAQRPLHAEPWGEVRRPLRVRMALHTGAAEVRDGDYFGPPLNRVARLLAAGHGGQMLLSQATAELVRDDLPAGAALRDLGEHRLQGPAAAGARLPACCIPSCPRDFPPLRSLEALPNNLPLPAHELHRARAGDRGGEAAAGARRGC